MNAPEVTFNMDLANGRTSLRFCYEAADVLAADGHSYSAAKDELDTIDDDNEFISEVVDEWTERLFAAGYYVVWNAGDVVVYDLRPLSEDDREAFYSEMENY